MQTWKFSPDGPCVIAIVDAEGDSVFDMSAGMHTVGQNQLLANAILVCAAPALLAALKELVAEWDARHADEDHRTGYTLDTGGVAMARAAIAQAKGAA